jgi:hypothetical protein
MMINDIKAGMQLEFYDGRRGEMADNKRGIIRTVEIYAEGGWFNDIGSCYVNEIKSVKVGDTWEKVELSDAHKKKLALNGY